ncbi:alpha/beta hydrolase fold domain-containing protein [Pseudomonas sp. CCM 7891]|uniref:Alpha/beta hydrolase fold domain-containing protein n=1 Tax=Pseudomonas karstica TaxID=1055468 RepID=A0A7X2UXK8_9PSED|nr:alpha/beta hydrolase [Pseudomonas karstica]MTD18132.1 alpha/beta hydrolase fold domain-containing protein [Pseudomonas karstica]
MSAPVNNRVSETRYPITDSEREAEKNVLAALSGYFANAAGSMREAYDRMTASTPIAEEMVCEPSDDTGVTGWWVRPQGAPSDRVIMFIHGGAYSLGSAQAYRGLASQLAKRVGVATFVLDYPLAPEQPFPAAFDAAVDALAWLNAQGITRISMVGDSAGAGLALASISAIDIRSLIASAVLYSPWVDLALEGGSFSSPNSYDPIFPVTDILANAAQSYLAGTSPFDGRASPLYASTAGLPPLLIQVGSDERLLDDARRYADRVAANGGEVHLAIYEGLHHVFQRSVMELQGARHALDAAAAFIGKNW